MKWIYSEASQKLWEKATVKDKKLAKQIYKKCCKTDQKKLIFIVDKPAIVMNALQVIFFPYDDNDGKSWWWYDEKEVEISIKQFNFMVTRNKIVKNELKRIKKYLKLNTLSPEKQIEAIHNYICDDIEYDYSYKHTSLYDGLFAKTVVCIGYSIVFKSLCDLCQIDCDILTNEDHAWNRVFINNKWLYLDATWNDSSNSKKYFLKPEDKFYTIHPKHTDIEKDIWMVNKNLY